MALRACLDLRKRCFRPLSCSSDTLQMHLSQRAHAQEVVGSHVQLAHPTNVAETAHHHLSDLSDGLGTAETLFDALTALRAHAGHRPG